MTFEIVTLPPDQWQAYRDLRLEALRTDPQAFGASYGENSRQPEGYWQGRLAQAAEGRRSWLLFARRRDRLVGMIGASLEAEGEVVEVISMYVTPAQRSQGVARALMAAILAALDRTAGLPPLRLAVNREQAQAVALYLHSGFEIRGEASVRMGDGREYAQLLMERRR
jgi:GNAT superfamily N-acetyltransferase